MQNWTITLALSLAILVGNAIAEDKPKPLEPPKGIELVKLKTAQVAAEGFVVPGSRVNVAFVTNGKKTVIVAENVLVYAVETKDNGETTYSVGMDKPQAEGTAKFLRDGFKPQLILRKPIDKQPR